MARQSSKNVQDSKNVIVTIDGPAGAGKSSAARGLAERLGFHFLDTGAMYRAVTLAAIERGLGWDQPDALAQLARGLTIKLTDERVFLDGRDVTQRVRTAEVTEMSHYAANNGQVRGLLVELQRKAAEGKDVVTEGRDQGTVVFPDAQCKVFLTASAQERARRRHRELLRRGEEVSFEQVLAQQQQRDERDRHRAVGPLVRAADALEIVTDAMSPQEVVDRLEAFVRGRLSALRR